MKKILMIVLDGFGFRKDSSDNFVPSINMEYFNNLWNKYPHTLLKASGEDIGLLKNQHSSSKIAHMTIGAGRALKQKKYIVDNFFKNPNLEDKVVVKMLKQKGNDVHLFGLLGDGAKEGNIDQVLNMYNLLITNGFTNIHFHLILDDDINALKGINLIRKAIKTNGIGDIVTICGKEYALDYVNNWNKVKDYYDLVVNGKGISAINIVNTVESLSKDLDNFAAVPPIIASNNIIRDGDSIIWMPYKSSTSKEFLKALMDEEFNVFPTNKNLDLDIFTFFSIDKSLKTNAILGKVQVKNAFGVYLGEFSLTQARIADAYKKLEVTSYFDGGFDEKINNCDKFISNVENSGVIKPEINAVDITKRVVLSMNSDYDFILVNLSNLDIIANLNNSSLLNDAAKIVDFFLEKILEKASENFYKVVICGSYDNPNINGDLLQGDDELVPFMILDDRVELKDDASITNIAPTILDYMDIAIPKEMEDSFSIIKKLN